MCMIITFLLKTNYGNYNSIVLKNVYKKWFCRRAKTQHISKSSKFFYLKLLHIKIAEQADRPRRKEFTILGKFTSHSSTSLFRGRIGLLHSPLALLCHNNRETYLQVLGIVGTPLRPIQSSQMQLSFSSASHLLGSFYCCFRKMF